MGKAQFFLDRDDYKRFFAVLPKDEQRAKLEKQFRQAHTEYQCQLRRRAELDAELASVSRETVRKPEPELAARMSMILAQQQVWPDVAHECAVAYATAFADWARATYLAFDAVITESEQAIAETSGEVHRLGRQLDRLSIRDPEHKQVKAQLTSIQKGNAPRFATQELAQRGRAAVQVHLNNELGECPGCVVSKRDIAVYADRRHSRKVAA